eukprot:6610802-Prymnesium_polylepis.1
MSPSVPPGLPPAPPPSSLSCDGGNGDDCTTVWLSTVISTCALEANQTCYLASLEKVDPLADEGGGLPWGMFLSLVGDVIISVGLALQKVAHNRVKEMKAELKASGSEAKEPEAMKLK